MGEGKVEMKGLAYPPEMVSSDEVVAMITNLNEARARTVVIQGVMEETEIVPLEITVSKPILLTARPQYPIVSLRAVPWNYGKGSEKTSEWTVVLPKNNLLYLPK